MIEIGRFTVVTGKGGVGKTSLSKAIAYDLAQKGKVVELFQFRDSNIKSTGVPSSNSEISPLGFKVNQLELLVEVQKYMTKKLRSKTIASWILKTPFFRAIFDMLPGFAYVIYLGSILERLNNNRELHAVLDSPSSGHALTMFEALNNFSEIFRSGVLFDDIQKMKTLINDPTYTQILIATLPTEMAANESRELARELKNLTNAKISTGLNQSLFAAGLDQKTENVPQFFKNKILTEFELSQSQQFNIKLPQIASIEENDIIKGIRPSLGESL